MWRYLFAGTLMLAAVGGMAALDWTRNAPPPTRDAPPAQVPSEASPARVIQSIPPSAPSIPATQANLVLKRVEPPPQPPPPPPQPQSQPPSPAPQPSLLQPPEPAEPPQPRRAAVTDPEMILVVGGIFQMGSNDDPSEQPVHPVSIASFFLAKYPVTVRQWIECVRQQGCRAGPGNGKDDAVMGDLSWEDAQQYVSWLSKATGHPYRLPSEAEWEYAARGGTTSRYWWGNAIQPNIAICRGCGLAVRPDRVGLRQPNPIGLYDLNDGIEEWTQDCWSNNYRGAPTDGSARLIPGCSERVLRGGAWNNDVSYVRSSSRNFYNTSVRYPTHGLRVAG